MDPWLESADIWPDFHDSFASEIRAYLNQTLPPPYYARLEMRPEIGVIDDENGSAYRRAIVPDVSVVEANRSAETSSNVGFAMAGPRTEISPCIEVVVPDEAGRHLSVEVRDSRRGHRLVTFIEVLSPANKTPGPDRRSYLKKHQEVFESDASLIEIDLLRAGLRTLRNLHLEDEVAKRRPADYLVLVNTGWSRLSGSGAWRIFPVSLRAVLPVVPVPLREGEAEVPLDLQHVFRRAYDSGPYRRGAIDYGSPAHPPLSDEDAGWARERLAAG